MFQLTNSGHTKKGVSFKKAFVIFGTTFLNRVNELERAPPHLRVGGRGGGVVKC